MLLYGSETWVLLTAALVSLEGFHILAANRMAVRHKPRRGPGNRWIYPKSTDMLEECGMSTLEEYIMVRRQTIAVYVATRPILIECRQGERKLGEQYRTAGGGSNRWTWTSVMQLEQMSDSPE
jgi:hypothetical protein